MTRVPFGTTSSPFLLSATIQHHLASVAGEYEATAMKLKQSFYVDDLVTGADSVEQAWALYQEALQIMKEAGMNLRKWMTNNEDLRLLLNGGQKQHTEITKTGPHLLSQEKILGVSWDRGQDKLQVALKSLFTFLLETADTKRYVLQASSRIFDPLGILSPFTVRVKRLFQKLWINGVEWDAGLPNGVLQDWKSWCKELPTLRLVSVSRYVGIRTTDSRRHLRLYTFSYASIHAYGVAVYVKVEDELSQLLVAKVRVATLKELTLPRLELMGALVAARLVSYVRTALFDCSVDCHFWTDSSIVLCWIQNEPTRWNQFVANRVAEIRTLSSLETWSHCISSDNPADLLTRGITAQRLVETQLWWNGPQWLNNDPAEWPLDNGLVHETDYELRHNHVKRQHALHVTMGPVEAILDINRYSSLDRLLEVTSYVQRFARNCLNPQDRKTGPLTPNELQEARVYWIRRVQECSYNEGRGHVPPALKDLQFFVDTKASLEPKDALNIYKRLNKRSIQSSCRPIIILRLWWYRRPILEYFIEAFRALSRNSENIGFSGVGNQ
ncbi:uncharacterized protein LOC135384434 [Ornithodoros turicata]|uniref:uncharacterized protein LOC135384434 n=1 Tax=Ornithodoros turicata TaxID=34597 RepID=UPI003138F0B0